MKISGLSCITKKIFLFFLGHPNWYQWKPYPSTTIERLWVGGFFLEFHSITNIHLLLFFWSSEWVNQFVSETMEYHQATVTGGKFLIFLYDISFFVCTLCLWILSFVVCLSCFSNIDCQSNLPSIHCLAHPPVLWHLGTSVNQQTVHLNSK